MSWADDLAQRGVRPKDAIRRYDHKEILRDRICEDKLFWERNNIFHEQGKLLFYLQNNIILDYIFGPNALIWQIFYLERMYWRPTLVL